ncbi:MAG: hypothetical protein DRP95_02325 [Candidatus Latescibacterota bacterium]|nr:MAG: hypothetical protein DRP95_02325 [Candidatus Latescibacterota bacterium]
MQTGQTLLVLGAFVLLSTIVLSMYRALLENQDAVDEAQYGIPAIALAQSVIEEASAKAFDEEVTGTPPPNLPEGFTHPSSLGPESGEHYPDFDDVDDYNGLDIQDTTSVGAVYNITASVYYVDSSDPDNSVSYRTFYKRIDVTVSSPFLSRAITLSHLFSYWSR